MRILVAGVAGPLGRLTAERFLADPEIEAVTGLDARACRPALSGMRFVRADVRRPEWIPLLNQVDVAVYVDELLSWQRTASSALIERVKSFARAVQSAGVRKLIVVNSAAIYGFQRANRVSEESPLYGYSAGPFARARAFVADYLEHVAGQNPALILTRLRSAWIVGPHFGQLARLLVHSPLLLCGGEGKLLQITHEDDVVSAVRFAAHRDLPDVYNLSSGDGLPWRDVIALTGYDRPCVSTLELLARSAWRWRWHKQGALPLELVRSLYRSAALETGKLRAAGWSAGHETADTLEETLRLEGMSR